MNYGTGICTLEFKPDHSDLGQWMCKFTVANEYSDEELGSASVVLLNSLGGTYYCCLIVFNVFLKTIHCILYFRRETRMDSRRFDGCDFVPNDYCGCFGSL